MIFFVTMTLKCLTLNYLTLNFDIYERIYNQTVNCMTFNFIA